MRIWLVTHHYAPEVGAPQRRWGALVPRLVAAGHTVSVFAPTPHYPSGRSGTVPPDEQPGRTATGEHGERIYRLPFREHGPDLLSRTVDQLVVAAHTVARGARVGLRDRDRPDVVIATVPGMPSIGAGVALHLLLRAPLVIEMRDAWPDLLAPSGILGSTRKRYGWRGVVTAEVHRFMTYFQRHAAAVVTTTDAFAQVLTTRRVRQVEVVRNGAYLDEIPVLGARRVTDEPLHVLYLGTVGRSQGLATAVRACARLHQLGEPVRLRIVGPGTDGERLRALAASLDAPVDFVGAVPRSEVFDHYRWADTLLVSLRAWLPFEWTVPSKLYESLATGRHVTGVLAGEAAGILRTTGAGDVVTPGCTDELVELWAKLGRDRTRLSVGDGGRRWAMDHADYATLSTQYLDLLDRVRR